MERCSMPSSPNRRQSIEPCPVHDELDRRRDHGIAARVRIRCVEGRPASSRASASELERDLLSTR